MASFSYDPKKWGQVSLFLKSFHASMFCYLADHESEIARPPIHSKGNLDLPKQDQGYGCFFSVNGFRNATRRTQENLYCLNAIYVDIDWPDKLHAPRPEEIQRFKSDVLESLLSLEMDSVSPSAIVETKNGYHAYWVFDRPIMLDNITKIVNDLEVRDEEQIQELFGTYQRLEMAVIDRFMGDPAAKDLSRVLRVPNTYHQKDLLHPFLVKIVLFEPERRYDITELSDYFLSEKTDPLKRVTEWADMEQKEKIEWKDADGERHMLTEEAVKELDRVYPKADRPSTMALMNRDGLPPGSRNHSLLIAVSNLRASGWNESQCVSYFDHYNGLSVYEIRSVIKSAYRRTPPYDFGWNHPLVAPHVNEMERARVSAILSLSFSKNKKLKASQLKQQMDGQTGVAMREEAQKDLKKSEAVDRVYQKNLYRSYEDIVCNRHPNLRYLDSVGFYEFEDGFFKPKTREQVRNYILDDMLQDGLLDFRTKSGVENKIICLESKEAIRIKRDDNEGYELLNLENGVLNVRTGELKPHNVMQFLTARIGASFIESPIETQCPRFLRFLHEIMEGNQAKMLLLQQIAGLCFTQNVSFQKAFIFHGTGANGKSTFIDVLMRLLGPELASSLTFRELHSQFSVAGLFHKRMNVIEEISNHYFESDLIKKIISGSEITADRKFLSSISFRPYAKVLFAVNQLPKINDTSHGLYRRFMIVGFNAKFSANKEPDLAEKLWEERNGILAWAVLGYQKLVQAGVFVMPPDVEEANESFKEGNSPLVECLLSRFELLKDETAKNYPITLHDLFQTYRSYCSEMGYIPKAFAAFSREVLSITHRELAHLVLYITPNGQRAITGLKAKPKTTF